MRYTGRGVVVFMVLVVFAVAFLLSCGGAAPDRAEAGMPLGGPIPQHGHSSVTDGGILGLTATLADNSGTETMAVSAYTILSFNNEVYDTLNIHDTVTNNSRFVVPNGYTWINISFVINSYAAVGSSLDQIHVYKNGSPVSGNTYCQVQWNASGSVRPNYGTTFWLPTVAGDYWELVYRNTDATNTKSVNPIINIQLSK